MSPTSTYHVKLGEREIPISTEALSQADILQTGTDTYHLIKDGKTYSCEVLACDLPAKQLRVRINGQEFDLHIGDQIDALVAQLGLGFASQAASKDVFAPMPGLVLDVLVQPGQEVAAGTKLLVLEAMKMENMLFAEHDGVIQSVAVAQGDAVDKRQLLIEVA